ncbi:uncharacterized protein [Nicotiana tomentosiformis]|uniref:uncharacterized protein n=1 Tax=Nicotiana tomentosiformis TaxID=4098 RepID=UPI00388CC0D1
MLAQIVASQAQRSSVGPISSGQPGESACSRVNKFLNLDPLVFTGTDPEEDPQYFIDEMHKTLRAMHTTETQGVELASYRLKGVAYFWFELWEKSCEEGSPPARWGEFTDPFMDHFLATETKAACAAKLEIMNQGSMNVWEFHMEFALLSKYAIHMLPTMEARVRRFVQGLSPLVMNEAPTAAFNSDMNYGKMVAFSQATESRKLEKKMECQSNSKARSAGNLGGGRLAFRGGSSRLSQSFAQSSMSAQSSGPETVRRFVAGLHSGIQASMAREVEMGTSYELVGEIAQRIEGVCQRSREQMLRDKRFCYSRGFNGAPSRGRGQFGRGKTSRPTYPVSSPPHDPLVRPYFSIMPESSYQPSAIQGSSGGYLGHQGQTSGQQSADSRGCYEFGDPGLM